MSKIGYDGESALRHFHGEVLNIPEDNTRAPLIAWVKASRAYFPTACPSSHDDYSRPWQMDNLLRREVEQADLAPIMTALLGIDYPVNSVKVFPDVDPTRPGYLLPRQGESALAWLAMANTVNYFRTLPGKHGGS